MNNIFDNKILILDDDKRILETLELLFEDRIREVQTVDNPNKVLEILKRTPPNILLMDMNYTRGGVDGKEGIALLTKIKDLDIQIPIVVMTAYGEVDLVVECMNLGAIDFIQKPWSNQRLLITVANALNHHKKENEVIKLTEQNKFYKNESSIKKDVDMIGSSNSMKHLRDKIKRVAESDANVLILGENGTGKELVAKAIHNYSLRTDSPFIKIDLGSIPEQLFESEMFGAKKGSYTGSQEDKVGRVTLADNGTLFLDEIGNLPLSMQAKMLSVLQNREVFQLGSTSMKKVNVRVLCATNLTINQLLDDSHFRQDLLYRINTVEIQVPALRDRKEDIPELFEYFKEIYEKKYSTGKLSVHPNTIDRIMMYSWPGNIRELQHATERAVLMCTENKIHEQDLIPNRIKSNEKDTEMDLDIVRMEKRFIEKALRLHNGNMTKASAELGITRTALYRRLEKYGL